METPTTVLLVEDSDSDANLLRQVFLRAGQEQWKLVHVERLAAAIDTCRRLPIDAVLLDLRLPDSDGLETVADFRAAVPDVPVVVLTMRDDEALALQAVARGAQDYLVKDLITIQLLVRSIRYAIERGQILQQLKNSEQAVLRALAQEQELSALKSSFIAMVSHEFRNPLSLIRTSVELLQTYSDRLTAERRRSYLHCIEAAVDQVLYVLDEVLLLGSAEAGALTYQPAPIDLEQLCQELLESVQVLASDRHQLQFSAAGSCDAAEMDAVLLRHILSNLLHNAIKYSPAGGEVRFTLECRPPIAIFTVRDQGIGIPNAEQHRLFESFHRCSNVGKIPGTGLGLAIVNRCVELHRGELQIKSEVNRGTTMTVMLPLLPSDPAVNSGLD